VLEQHAELWPAEGDRPRRWHASIAGPNDPVIVRHMAILEPCEDLTEYPKTYELSAGEWAENHGDFGLNADGSPVEVTP
jgi:hypothetical protein